MARKSASVDIPDPTPEQTPEVAPEVDDAPEALEYVPDEGLHGNADY